MVLQQQRQKVEISIYFVKIKMTFVNPPPLDFNPGQQALLRSSVLCYNHSLNKTSLLETAQLGVKLTSNTLFPNELRVMMHGLVAPTASRFWVKRRENNLLYPLKKTKSSKFYQTSSYNK